MSAKELGFTRPRRMTTTRTRLITNMYTDAYIKNSCNQNVDDVEETETGDDVSECFVLTKCVLVRVWLDTRQHTQLFAGQ